MMTSCIVPGRLVCSILSNSVQCCSIRLICVSCLEGIIPAPVPLQRKQMPGTSWNFQEKHPNSVQAPVGWLHWCHLQCVFLSPSGWHGSLSAASLTLQLCLGEQTAFVNDSLREHVQDEPRASLHGNVRGEAEEWAESSSWMERVMLLLEAEKANPVKESMRAPHRVSPHGPCVCREGWETLLCTWAGAVRLRGCSPDTLIHSSVSFNFICTKGRLRQRQTKPLETMGYANRTLMED